MQPTIIFSLGETFPAFPNADAETIYGKTAALAAVSAARFKN
jgi:hypothetical protein